MSDKRQQEDKQLDGAGSVTGNGDSGNSKLPPSGKKNQEIGGRGGLDPSRFGDWEIAGKCVDF